MRKFISIVFLFGLFLITGCGHQVHMDITDTQMTLKITSELLETEILELEEMGFNVSVVPKENAISALELTKVYNLDEISDSKPVIVNLEKIGTVGYDDSKYFQVEKKRDSSTYKASFFFDATTDREETDVRLTYSVNLPIKPISHNADVVSGNKLTWNITVGEIKEIDFQFRIEQQQGSNPAAMIIIGIGVVFGIGAGISYLRRRKKYPSYTQPELDYHSMMQPGLVSPIVQQHHQQWYNQPLVSEEQHYQQPVYQQPVVQQYSQPEYYQQVQQYNPADYQTQVAAQQLQMQQYYQQSPAHHPQPVVQQPMPQQYYQAPTQQQPAQYQYPPQTVQITEQDANQQNGNMQQ